MGLKKNSVNIWIGRSEKTVKITGNNGTATTSSYLITGSKIYPLAYRYAFLSGALSLYILTSDLEHLLFFISYVAAKFQEAM
jgi:hypothetical protein